MQAVQAALGGWQNGPTGCNEGFLRDDAILVLVLITDEEDDNIEDGEGSPGDPAAWYEAVVAAKRGVPENAVVLGLLGDGNLPGGLCPLAWNPKEDGGEASPRLQSFVKMFPAHVLGSVGMGLLEDFALAFDYRRRRARFTRKKRVALRPPPR